MPRKEISPFFFINNNGRVFLSAHIVRKDGVPSRAEPSRTSGAFGESRPATARLSLSYSRSIYILSGGGCCLFIFSSSDKVDANSGSCLSLKYRRRVFFYLHLWREAKRKKNTCRFCSLPCFGAVMTSPSAMARLPFRPMLCVRLLLLP